MKILHVITSLYTGGAEKLMVDMLPRMRDQGHYVELCVFCGDRTPFYEQLRAKNIKIHSFHKGLSQLYNPLNLYRLVRLLRKGKYDIVHTHNTAPQLYAALASICCKITLITTEHNTTNRRRDKAYLKSFDNWMYGRYSQIICISDQAEENYRKYLGDSNSVCTIYNGIDYNKYSNAKYANDIRKIGTKIITNVAAFRPQKDQPTLIKAMQYLPEDFHLCLVGSGDERRKEFFEVMIAEYGLGNRVHLLGMRSDVPEVLAASDYVVMCSHYEGLSLSSLEGMASGKPFLADNVDGLYEIVKGNGVLFEHEDAKGFADAIMKLDNDDRYRELIGRQCQNKAINYDINIMVAKYLEMYKLVLWRN